MSYLLTDAAEADMRSIIRYTRKQWGAAQVRSYIAKLTVGIANVAIGKGVFKQLDTLYPTLRIARCEHHYVFCLPRQDAPALIIAIFHERMDLTARLADRLS
ncbi:MAG: type II toxin-antitoxin system RelE/ParE family toxin [Asticcacaulis sp.]|uniref:type II toxin-antitoxin system RelE/ParE family toxin n=1 Tax=Asticcacaulis sp. TaxID=1872648 RepID=UPI003F7C6177